jgi:DNA-binding IclR family transcriptional regulator
MTAQIHRIPPKKTGSKSIQSVEIGVRVLDVLAGSVAPLPLRDIARVAALSPSQTHRYLASYVKTGLVRQDASTGYYDLGERALRWGLAAMSRIDGVELAVEALKRLSVKFDVTGMVSIWGERGATCIRLQRGSTLIGTDVGLGTIFPVFESATGQIFLTYLPEAVVRSHVPRKRATEAARIRETVRARGYAIAEGHFVSSLSAVAAPVFDSQGEIVAAIALVDRATRLDSHHERFIAGAVAEARAVSRSLGYLSAQSTEA